MNTAEYITSLIAGKVVELAIAGGVWSLFYSQRILFAASPKPQQPPHAADAKAKDRPKAEAPEVAGGPDVSLVPGMDQAA